MRRRGARSRTACGLRQLARDGVVFEHTYSQASWTRPSIATILTAEYPSVHGTEHKMDFLSDRVDTIAEVLKAQGYWTAAFTTNINVAPIFNFQQGFDEFRYLEPSFYFGATDSATKLAIYKGLRVAREKVSRARCGCENYYQDAGRRRQHVEAWLGEQPPEPFFLFVHYMDPHDPYFEIPYNGHGVARVIDPRPGRRARARSCTTSICRACATSTATSTSWSSGCTPPDCTTAASSRSPPTTARSSTSTAAGGTARRCTRSRCTCR